MLFLCLELFASTKLHDAQNDSIAEWGRLSDLAYLLEFISFESYEHNEESDNHTVSSSMHLIMLGVIPLVGLVVLTHHIRWKE